jgi:hypothetical protein
MCSCVQSDGAEVEQCWKVVCKMSEIVEKEEDLPQANLASIQQIQGSFSKSDVH